MRFVVEVVVFISDRRLLLSIPMCQWGNPTAQTKTHCCIPSAAVNNTTATERTNVSARSIADLPDRPQRVPVVTFLSCPTGQTKQQHTTRQQRLPMPMKDMHSVRTAAQQRIALLANIGNCIGAFRFALHPRARRRRSLIVVREPVAVCHATPLKVREV